MPHEFPVRRSENMISDLNQNTFFFVLCFIIKLSIDFLLFVMFSRPKTVATANVIDVLSAFHMCLIPIEHFFFNIANFYGVGMYKDE